MTSDLDGAVRSGPGWAGFDDALRALLVRGWRFQHVTDEEGHIGALVGTYGWPGCYDRLHVHSEDEAAAARVVMDTRPGTEEILWSYVGDATTAIRELLELPPPHQSNAPTRARRAPLGLWLPAGQPRFELASPWVGDTCPARP